MTEVLQIGERDIDNSSNEGLKREQKKSMKAKNQVIKNEAIYLGILINTKNLSQINVK
jgi:hypothetical protein